MRTYLEGHFVRRLAEMGWDTLENGELIRSAEKEGFDVIVTTDQNLRYQQNLKDIRLAFVVLMATAWPRVQGRTTEIREAIENVEPGEVCAVPI